MAIKKIVRSPDWTLAQCLEAYIERLPDANACWLWKGYKDKEGYALLWWEGKLHWSASRHGEG